MSAEHTERELVGMKDVLLIARLDGLENCARALEQHTGGTVEVATGPDDGLSALRRPSSNPWMLQSPMRDP